MYGEKDIAGVKVIHRFVNLRMITCYMSKITITKLYELLISKLGKEGAENLTTFIENKIDYELEDNTKRLATKEDLANVRTKVESVRTEVANVRIEIESVRTEVANVKGELLDKMGQLSSNITWRMFLFWIGQLAGTISIILLVIKK